MTDNTTPALLSEAELEAVLIYPLGDNLQRLVTHIREVHRLFDVPCRDSLVSPSWAADYLNVPYRFYLTLLDDEAIPEVKVGTARMVRFSDLHAYKVKRNAERHEALNELARESYELGLYDLPISGRHSDDTREDR